MYSLRVKLPEAFCSYFGSLLLFIILANALDYCKWDTFNAECAKPDEVVIMTSALYGRMERSNCIERDYGYVGCSGDVMTMADARCSGRRKCSIEIPDKTFDKSSICPKDLTRYFSATYMCQKVFYPRRSECYGSIVVRVTNSPNFLASVVSEETGCGVTSSPWEVQAKSGQRISFTLYDFSRLTTANESNTLTSSATQCHVYAVLKEKEYGRSFTVCSTSERERSTYLSISHSVEVRFMSNKITGRDRHFLLKFEAIGCGDPEVTAGEWFERGNNETTVHCPTSGASWRLICIGNEWKGQRGNCTLDETVERAAGVVFDSGLGSKGMSALLIPLVLFIAVIIGVSILVIGLVYMMRRRKLMTTRKSISQLPHSHRYDSASVGKETYYKALGRQPPMYVHSDGVASSEMGVAEENEYEYVDDVLRRISQSTTLHHAYRDPRDQCYMTQPTSQLTGASEQQYGISGQRTATLPTHLPVTSLARYEERAVPRSIHGSIVYPQYFDLDSPSARQQQLTMPSIYGGNQSFIHPPPRRLMSSSGMSGVSSCGIPMRSSERNLPEQQLAQNGDMTSQTRASSYNSK